MELNRTILHISWAQELPICNSESNQLIFQLRKHTPNPARCRRLLNPCFHKTQNTVSVAQTVRNPLSRCQFNSPWLRDWRWWEDTEMDRVRSLPAPVHRQCAREMSQAWSLRTHLRMVVWTSPLTSLFTPATVFPFPFLYTVRDPVSSLGAIAAFHQSDVSMRLNTA